MNKQVVAIKGFGVCSVEKWGRRDVLVLSADGPWDSLIDESEVWQKLGIEEWEMVGPETFASLTHGGVYAQIFWDRRYVAIAGRIMRGDPAFSFMVSSESVATISELKRQGERLERRFFTKIWTPPSLVATPSGDEPRFIEMGAIFYQEIANEKAFDGWYEDTSDEETGPPCIMVFAGWNGERWIWSLSRTRAESVIKT
jgi:hypothetical protein